MNRLPFLDWARGFAVLVMIQCHVFNSFLRFELRQGAAYILSQYIGGIAAVLFLFLAGVTFAFQMDSAERREPQRRRRVWMALKRAGYISVLAALFRISNWAFSIPFSPWWTMLKVDILNCMALAMAAFSVAAAFSGAARARFAAGAGLAIAALSPLVSVPPETGAPELLRNYLQPSFRAFAFFPWAAYLAFGIALGTILRRVTADRFERFQQWCVLIGFGLIAGGQYFANLPHSLYSHSEFWLNSPALILIRGGVVLVLMAGAYLWTAHGAGRGWSWVQTLGKTSLMAYWVHVLLVYGSIAYPLKKILSVAETLLATVLVTGLMLGLSAAKLYWLPGAKQAWTLRFTRERVAAD